MIDARRMEIERSLNPSLSSESLGDSVWQILRKGPLKVCVIGSGNWGSAVCKIVGENAKRSYIFQDTVNCWVFEETFEGRKLTEIINTDHENKKYLPGIKLPTNVVAVPDLSQAAKDADLLVFVMPHQFLERTCKELKSCLSPHAKAISLIKGLHIDQGHPKLLSQYIKKVLEIDCSVLSGANVAKDVAREEFSESTIGYSNLEAATLWQQLFDTTYFRVNAVPDIAGVEVCGALKNVIALAAGFVDGLHLGSNAKAAIIRLGVQELRQFALMFFEGVLEETFFDSAGLADVITTCFGGRNVKCAAEFVTRKGQSSWEDLEKEILGGQKLQGTLTAKEVQEALKYHQLMELFPLFTTAYKIAYEGEDPMNVIRIFQSDVPRAMKKRHECTPCLVTQNLMGIKRSLERQFY